VFPQVAGNVVQYQAQMTSQSVNIMPVLMAVSIKSAPFVPSTGGGSGTPFNGYYIGLGVIAIGGAAETLVYINRNKMAGRRGFINIWTGR